MSDLAATQSFYGRWARLYDLLASAPGVTAWRRRAVASLSLSPGDTVVEMGCGTGANLPSLREQVGPDGTVLALDVTPGVLARARERVVRAGWENVHVCRADATRPPVAGVDAVLATFVVGMLDTPAAAVADWAALAPGGRVALLNFQRSDRTLAFPVLAAFEAFVWLSTPGITAPSELPSATLDRRVQAAREALTARAVDREYETLAGGFLGLLSGQIPD